MVNCYPEETNVDRGEAEQSSKGFSEQQRTWRWEPVSPSRKLDKECYQQKDSKIPRTR